MGTQELRLGMISMISALSLAKAGIILIRQGVGGGPVFIREEFQHWMP